MTGYYSEKLSGKRLQQCYELASPRVVQYLEAEILHVLERVRPEDSVLELGCGYGRVTARLARAAHRTVGIDTAAESLDLARRLLEPGARCEFALMDALDLDFQDDSFDVVACLQNGICAFGVDRHALLQEALRVARPGGIVLFSTYSDRFWDERLVWFEAQAEAGLLGPIDHSATGDGVIVCRDGFRAGRLTPGDLRRLASRLGVAAQIVEVDESSVFCEIVKQRAGRTPR